MIKIIENYCSLHPLTKLSGFGSLKINCSESQEKNNSEIFTIYNTIDTELSKKILEYDVDCLIFGISKLYTTKYNLNSMFCCDISYNLNAYKHYKLLFGGKYISLIVKKNVEMNDLENVIFDNVYNYYEPHSTDNDPTLRVRDRSDRVKFKNMQEVADHLKKTKTRT